MLASHFEGPPLDLFAPDHAEYGRKRVVVLDPTPIVDGGRFAVKRVLGDTVTVSCDVICDGHDKVAGVVRVERPAGAGDAFEVPLVVEGNDRFSAQFDVSALGEWSYRVEAWVDEYGTWLHNVQRKLAARQDVSLEFLHGAELIVAALDRVPPQDEAAKTALAKYLTTFVQGSESTRMDLVSSGELPILLQKYPERKFSTRSQTLKVDVEPKLAEFSAWYELFPRSLGEGSEHGTFADVERMLPYVAEMGFDVLYFPPIHPIGHAYRKGPNNSLQAAPGDPGSPWAIGAAEGGHKAFHPQLGTEVDFVRLVAKARDLGLEIALDIAFQASPDHPYVAEHPEWFVHRADGSIQYAENPPKKYQDVYPFDIAGAEWRSLWLELRSVFDVWINRGVRVFRVDNPHTKPIPFWEYCISEIKREHPDVLFLAEAFTRPKLMYALAKVGFSQSYTYFTWRTSATQLRQYLTELTSLPVSDFFRPNFWPNTPDILPEHLQQGNRAMFISRMTLAGTLSASWGIYGPAFELLEHVPREGAEEYIDNEKFQLRSWNLERPDSLRPVIKRLNRIRRENAALQSNRHLVFHEADNPNVIVYSKSDTSGSNVILVVANLMPYFSHSSWLTLNLDALGVEQHETFQVHDLMSEARYQWQGRRAYVELEPSVSPVHVFRIRRHQRTEHSFEYFL